MDILYPVKVSSSRSNRIISIHPVDAPVSINNRRMTTTSSNPRRNRAIGEQPLSDDDAGQRVKSQA